MNTLTLTKDQEAQWIEEILQEASAFGLRWEVTEWAKKFMVEDPGLEEVVAYQLAFVEWVK